MAHTFTDLDELVRWLSELPPAERVRTCRLLADGATTAVVAQLADATIYRMTRESTAAAVAEELDITLRQVQRAVANHRERER